MNETEINTKNIAKHVIRFEMKKKGVKTSSSAHEGRSSWSSCCVESKQAMRDRRKSRNPSYLDALARARMMEEIDPDWEVTNAELDEDEEL